MKFTNKPSDSELRGLYANAVDTFELRMMNTILSMGYDPDEFDISEDSLEKLELIISDSPKDQALLVSIAHIRDFRNTLNMLNEKISKLS